MQLNKGDFIRLKPMAAMKYPTQCRYDSYKILNIKDSFVQGFRTLYSATGKETSDIRMFKLNDIEKLKEPITPAERLKGFYESFYN